MEIVKLKGFNNYDFTGLTEGKLFAILHALEELEHANKITAVEWDVLVALRHWWEEAKAEDKKEEVAEGSLRVWWVQNPPRDAERYPVKTIEEAIAILGQLTRRDLALGDTVDCNAGGLEVFEDGDWSEYYDEHGRDIGDIEREESELKG